LCRKPCRRSLLHPLLPTEFPQEQIEVNRVVTGTGVPKNKIEVTFRCTALLCTFSKTVVQGFSRKTNLRLPCITLPPSQWRREVPAEMPLKGVWCATRNNSLRVAQWIRLECCLGQIGCATDLAGIICKEPLHL
ncbi:MAG: hypothetical protein IKB48_00935, partial [Bacteroidales bacterium]|nr:hypothetical protein [Bacteroidales bacterium]